MWMLVVGRVLTSLPCDNPFNPPAGADFHDHHHMVFKGNYATSFRWCDWIFGTDRLYNEWKAKQEKQTKEKTK